MKRYFISILSICLVVVLTIPLSVHASVELPPLPPSAEDYMPNETETLGQGIWQILLNAFDELNPVLIESIRSCVILLAIVIFISIFDSFTGSFRDVLNLISAVCIGSILLKSSQNMIQQGTYAIKELSTYSKLFFPVITGSLAAQGGVTTATALYTGTMVFDAVIGYLIEQLMIPGIYIFICLSFLDVFLAENSIGKIKLFFKETIIWILKILMYVFTGYLSITGVISGTTDAAALKATKITISGVVPIVGGILSDASETILVGAGIIKNAAGVYGILAVLAVSIGPFLTIGMNYLMLKLTAGLSGCFGRKTLTAILSDFTTAMGLILAMTGACGLLLIISTICYMKGFTG